MQRVEQVANILRRPWVYHLGAWLLYILLMLIVNGELRYWQFTLRNIVIHSFFLALLVYANLFYLLPTYFKKRKFLSYFVYLSFVVALVLPLELRALFYNMQAYPALQLHLLDTQWVHFGFLWFAALSTTVATLIKEWFVQQQVQSDLEKRTLQSELSFLRSQINPHFLFNVLNSLYALSLKKSDSTPEMILRLSQLMRYMLYECNEKRVALEKELSYIQNYLELERLRFGEKARIDFEYELDREDYEIVPLLFVPFLENAIKHGLAKNLGEEAFIEVELYIEQGELNFIVRNSYKKEVEGQGEEPGGIGLSNIRRRLSLLYSKKHRLDLREYEDMYSVHLSLDLQKT